MSVYGCSRHKTIMPCNCYANKIKRLESQRDRLRGALERLSKMEYDDNIDTDILIAEQALSDAKSRTEKLGIKPTDLIHCIHCREINLESAVYCMRCGKSPQRRAGERG